MSETIPNNLNLSCPACLSNKHNIFFEHTNRHKKYKSFYYCQNCNGVFRHPEQFLSPDDEKKRYDGHHNHLEDPRYIQYLNASLEVFRPFIPSESLGLDFGCGPTKGFEFLSKNESFEIESYDKYYYPMQNSSPDKKYDFVIAHEVVEHFTDCLNDFKKLLKFIKQDGWLLIRTEPYPDQPDGFANWNYKNDPTHVFFFNQKCFEVLAQNLNLSVQQIDHNKWALQVLKPASLSAFS